MKGGSL